MTGFDSSMRVGPIGPSPVGLSRLPSLPMALRSAPAQNVPPAPQRTAARIAGSASTARNASASSRAVCASTAFFRSGRSRTMVATAPALSIRTGILRSPRPLACRRTRPTQVALQRALARELRGRVQHAKILHREARTPRTPMGLAHVEIDLNPALMPYASMQEIGATDESGYELGDRPIAAGTRRLPSWTASAGAR